jgi:hypothetical protein
MWNRPVGFSEFTRHDGILRGGLVSRRIRLALETFILGFVVEGGTETYQFVGYGHSVWIGLYYVGLITTGVGFYLMYQARHEWTDVHRRNVRRGHQLLWTALAIFAGAVAAIAILGSVDGAPGHAGPPAWVVWVVGGLVALAFGDFFFSLVVLVEHLVGTTGRLITWVALAWSLGIAVWTGYMVGQRFLTLLHQFFTNPIGLIASFAPLAFVIAPLFVAYFLFAVAYTEALWRVRRHPPLGRAYGSAGPGRFVMVPDRRLRHSNS